MVPLKLSLTFDPPQIGLFYQRHPQETKKHVYIIQLHGLIFLGDSAKITMILFEQHSDYLSPDIINPHQVQKFVEKLLSYLKSQLLEYEAEEEQEDVDKSTKLVGESEVELVLNSKVTMEE